MNKGKSPNQVVFFPCAKCRTSPSSCIKYVPFALLATIWKHQSTRFYLQKRATLPYRPLSHEQRKKSQAGSFFCVCKMPNFAFQYHEVTFHLRLWRRSGSVNQPVSTCRRGRRCPVAACSPCLGFAGGQKVVAVFSNLAAAINYLP